MIGLVMVVIGAVALWFGNRLADIWYEELETGWDK